MLHQAHAFLAGLLEICAVYGVTFLVVGVIVGVASVVGATWRRLRRNSRLDYQRYQAEEAIRAIKRRAVHEMLTAERQYRDLGGSDEIIEGTAVEVRE
jgi:hypothetical protein